MEEWSRYFSWFPMKVSVEEEATRIEDQGVGEEVMIVTMDHVEEMTGSDSRRPAVAMAGDPRHPVGTATSGARRRAARRSTEPPRRRVRARRPLTDEHLLERADVTAGSTEAAVVARIFDRRRTAHAALYVAELRDLAALWSAGDDEDEHALHALAASAALRSTIGRGEGRLRDAHLAVTDLPRCLARVESGALPADWFDGLIRHARPLTAVQRAQLDERVAAWDTPSITPETFRTHLRLLAAWFHPADPDSTPEAKRDVTVRPSEDGDGTACLSVVGPALEILDMSRRLDAAARAVQDEQRHLLESGALDQRRSAPFDIDDRVRETGRPLPLGAIRYALLVRSLIDTGGIEVPGSPFRLSVVVPALTLLGRSSAPATMEGTTPIPPAMARDLAARAPAWERVLTDPVTGEFLPVASTTYRPTRAMTEHLRLLDPICAVPGCTRTVSGVGEVDHIEEFDHEHPEQGGPTTPENLHWLCQLHHALKTAGLFDPERDADGRTRWNLGGLITVEDARHGDLVTQELTRDLTLAWDEYQARKRAHERRSEDRADPDPPF